MRRPTLHLLDKLVNPILWVYFNEKMDVIGHDFEFYDAGASLLGDLPEHFLQPSINSIHKNGTSILGTEYHMVLGRVHDILVGLVLH